jgi:hypothetical protein
MRLSMRSFLVVLMAAAFGGGVAAPALADTPNPVPGTPSCQGQIVATYNHNSGVFGPSGNPNASAGPGSFLGPDTHAAIEGARSLNCG